MIRLRKFAPIAVALLVGLCSIGSSVAEDCCVTIAIPNAVGLNQQLAKTRPGSFMNAIPGGTFVITVAQISPSPEDAMIGGTPVTCSAVPFRVDTIKLGATSGIVDVALGQRQELAPGESRRIIHKVGPSSANLPIYELDQLGFILRSGVTASRCSIFANAMFYPDATSTPVPVALIPSVHSELNSMTGGNP